MPSLNDMRQRITGIISPVDPIIQGIIAGYGIAIPVGAIAILIIETGLRYGFRFGFAAGAGAATADFIYASLASVAGQTLIVVLAPYASISRTMSAVVLGVIGLWGLWKARKRYNKSSKPADPGPNPHRHARHTYLRFVALTSLNPMTIAYFGAIILGGSNELAGWKARLLFVLGAAISSLSWQTFIAGVGAYGRRRFSPEAQRLISIVGNLMVIALGIRMLWV